ncbi:MAG: hypothetical protein U0414_06255 [Polyangiaceae bacterium]
MLHRLSVPRRAGFVALTVLAGACFLPDLDLAGRPCPCADGFVCDAATQTCVTDPSGTGSTAETASSTGVGGQTSSTTSGMSTTSTASSASSGTGGAPGVPATPLVRSGATADGAIGLTVQGAFRLEFTATTNWQLQRWFDLPTSDVVNLASQVQRNMLHEPIEMEVGGIWGGADEAQFVDVSLTDETPARAILDTTLRYPSGGAFTVHNTYSVYASGRVGVRVVIQNLTASDQTFDASEVHHTSVNEMLAWAHSTLANGDAAMFQRTDGATPLPTVLTMSFGTVGSPGQDFPTNYYWDTGGQTTLMPGQTFARTGEFQVGLGDQTVGTLSSRAADVLAPSLVVTGAGVGNGYDSGAAAYVIQASGGEVSFGASADVDRFAPAFVIDGWSAQDWTLTRDGMTVATSAMPIGFGVLVHHDVAASRLVVVSVDAFRTTTPAAQRTFTLTPI